MQKKLFPVILSVLSLAIIWQIIAILIGYPAIFPTLEYLANELLLLIKSKDFLQNVLITIIRGFVGFSLAFVLALVLSIFSGFNSFCKNFLLPVLVLLRSIPVISFVLLAILWFSPTQLPVFIALLTMFPILYQNILTAFEQTDTNLVEMAKVFGKNSLNRLNTIYLPASAPGIFDGISTAMGYGWRAIIIGEVLAQPIHGIGTAMKNAQAFINVSELIAWTVVAVLVSSLFELFIKLIRKIHIEFKLPDSGKYNLKNSKKHAEIKQISIIDLEKRFNDNILFNTLNASFKTGQITCLKGVSGKGKSTLLKLLVGIQQPDNGIIQIPANIKYAYAFQDFRLLPWLTVTENIAYVIDAKKSKQEVSNLIGYLLERLELTEQAHAFPHQISGGQQQRVSLARALASKSDIILLDEPLTGLDAALKQRIISFLDEWFACYQPIVIWATHEVVKLKNFEVNELVLENQ